MTEPIRRRIRPLAYLRAMWSVFWSAFTHPRSVTVIDLSTGRVVRHYKP